MTRNVAEPLLGPELFWRDSYTWLKQSEYLLRLRSSPGWTPPWKNDATKNAGRVREIPLPSTAIFMPPPRSADTCSQAPQIINATRVADGGYAILKRSERSDAALSQEVYMFRQFSPEPLASDVHNSLYPRARGFCMFQMDFTKNLDLIVMPLLSARQAPVLDDRRGTRVLYRRVQGSEAHA
ncbi:hypothetical protein B0H16DRAFT_1728207 [Mycena metata]|uniref:Uncharacterized protein n=1 Tax=Mycena metata TaxID=1033252 RepID=A0AAD7IH41_9AGAR|nr:hypothetical protein B0H16DRAFT_1728207 [Mycena metata]